MKITTKILSFLLACGSLFALSSVHAADGTWTLNNNGNWSDAAPANWQGGIVADGVGFSAYLSDVINANRNITLSGDRTIGNIYAQDTSNNYSIIGTSMLTLDVSTGKSILDVVTGRTLTISAPVTTNDGLEVNGAGIVNLSGGVTLASSDTWDVSGYLAVGGTIGDGGNGYGLTKTGSGILNIRTATFGYTGPTIVNGGVLLTGNNLSTNNMTLNGGMLSDYYRATTVFTGGLGAGDNQIQIYGASGFGGGNGNSNWRIGAQNSVLQWGSTHFNPTALKFLSAADNMGPTTYGTVTLQNGLDLNGGARTIDVLGATGVNALVSSWGRVDGGITDTGSGGSLIKTGGGNLIIGGTSDYTGGTTINSGALRFDSIAAMPGSGNVQVNDGAILGIKLGGAGNWTDGTSGVGTLGGLLAGEGGAGTSSVGYSGNVGVLLDVAATTTYAGDIANVGTTLALYKAGGSTLTLAGNNTHTGGTFLNQGTLIADSANALGSGQITFSGGTLQYTSNTAAADFGSQFKNSASAILINSNGQNVKLSGIDNSNTGGLTKSGAGTLTFTGTNTYSGATTLNAGAISVYDGTLTTSGGAVSMVSDTSISVLGGTGVTSTWDVGNQQFGTGNNNYTNIQVLIDGDGVAGSALLTNVNNLVFGRTAANSDMIVTNGGQINVNGDIRIGDTYYNTLGNTTLTIGGGTATSTVTGNNTKSFYIGFGEREGSNNNVVTVNSGGVLTGVGDMFVGHVNNTQGNGLPSTANQLKVTGTGTASMKSITVGYAQNTGIVSDSEEANANVVEVTSGGQLTTSAVSYVGRANANFTESNDNTLTVSGTGSSWDAGDQDVYVGHTNNAGATSNGNILTVGTGGVVTNVKNLTVGFGSGTETGNQLVVNGSLTVNTLTVSTSNSLSGSGTINGAITVNGALSPGNSPGQMTVADSLSLGAASSTLMELGGTALGTGYDNITLQAAGALVYGGALSVVNFGAYDMDTASFTYDLFSLNGVVPTGDFASVMVNSTPLTNSSGVWSGSNGGVDYTFDQALGDLTVNAIPEPSAAALLAGLGAMLLLRRRR